MSSFLTAKRWGQNFLRDPALAASLIADLPGVPGAMVIEIGPGRGILTRELAVRAQRVIAVERDPVLAARLRRDFAGTNVRIVRADFRSFPLPHAPYVAVGNIPFGITAATLAKLFTAPHAPDAIYLLVQREAAEKYAGSPHETQASMLLKPWFSVAIRRIVGRAAFVPVPGVDAALLAAEKRGPPLIADSDAALYRAFIRYGFGRWRGEVRANLRPVFSNMQYGILARTLAISPGATPSQLTFHQWLALFVAFQTLVPERKQAAVLAWATAHPVTPRRDLPAWLALPRPPPGGIGIGTPKRQRSSRNPERTMQGRSARFFVSC